jgi:hypothetical protein
MSSSIGRLALIAALAWCSTAQGTTLRLRSLEALVAESDQIAEVRVVASHAEQEGPEAPIFTVYEVESLDWLRAGPLGRPARFVVRQPGGTVGDLTMVASGAAHFRVGERVLLFTTDYGTGFQQVSNLAQGAVRIEGAATGAAAVAPRVRAEAPFPGGAPEDLAAFKQRVRDLVAAGAP